MVNTKTIPDELREEHRIKLANLLTEGYTDFQKSCPYFVLSTVHSLKERIEKITTAIMMADEDSQLTLLLLKMQQIAPELFTHSLSVSFMSMFLLEQITDFSNSTNNKQRLYEKEVLHMGIAGLLHDIGKISQKNNTVLEKTENMTSFQQQQYRNHVVNSNALLRDKKLDGCIVQGILQHHERCDGSGFPLNLHNEEIGQIGKILAITDEYCHLIQEQQPTPDVIYMIYHLETKTALLDVSYLSKFWSGILDFFVEKPVRLSDNTVALLHSVNEKHPRKSSVSIDGRICVLDSKQDLEIIEMA